MRELSLVAQAREGDETAWAAIVELHWQAVWTLSRRIVRDQQGAEEVTQETFRVVKERLAEYRGQGALCAWIQAICRHQALDELRRRRRHAREVCLDECADVRGRPVAIEERMVQRIDLERALALLAEEEREALLLTEAGYTSEELALTLGVAATTIRSRRARARARLVKELAGGYGGRAR
ncbi:MAG TPA: sigma-70 family RNA polymerase sigma factor [Candidatus Dormibacteraeota bacterium]|nr:sigma-70 family RNA polymerase sigma factor [Candidatus Dormibacteraeota bacterium]